MTSGLATVRPLSTPQDGSSTSSITAFYTDSEAGRTTWPPNLAYVIQAAQASLAGELCTGENGSSLRFYYARLLLWLFATSNNDTNGDGVSGTAYGLKMRSNRWQSLTQLYLAGPIVLGAVGHQHLAAQLRTAILGRGSYLFCGYTER